MVKEEYSYEQIVKLISDVEIETMINIMVKNRDNTGKFFALANSAEDFVIANVKNPEVFKLIEERAKIELDNINSGDIFRKQLWKKLNLLNVDSQKPHIYKGILHLIEQKAKRRWYDRVFLRHHIGDNIVLKSLEQCFPLLDHIEFLKDGGWGIVNNSGNVLVRNHLIHRPSESSNLIEKGNSYFRLIQDRDTELYGVLSLLSFKEVVHCQYEKIEVVECEQDNNTRFVIKVKKNDKWGCYDDNCALIVDCRYDDICIKSEWIECSRDGSFLYPEYEPNEYGLIYEGIKDLYDTEGSLMLGGYNYLEYDNRGFFKFYFGTKYEEYYTEEIDFYGRPFDLSNYKLNYENSWCLVLDRRFRTMVRCNEQYLHIPLGKVFQSVQEVYHYVPSDFLFSGKVDLSDYNTFVYLKKEKGEKFFISDYIEEFEQEEFDDSEVIKEFEPNIVDESLFKQEKQIDHLIEDDEVVIIRLAEDGSVLWHYKVNEIYHYDYDSYLYRIGEKVGFYSSEGVSDAKYAASTIDFKEGKTYIAKTIKNSNNRKDNYGNPNYVKFREHTIQFFEMKETGELIKMEDNWNIFNPQKYIWFPKDFLIENGFIQ